MLVVRTLPAGPEAPGAARELVRRLPLASEPRSNLELIVSELVANSVVHGGNGVGAVTVLLRSDDAGVRGEVRDGGQGFDWQPSLPDLSEPGGLGLVLVDRLTEDWGVRRDPTACVWFVVSVFTRP